MSGRMRGDGKRGHKVQSPLTPEQVKRAAAKAKRERLENEFEGQLKAAGIRNYVKQHKFHPTRKWAFDFAFTHAKLAVEIEGGKWIQGRHQRPSGFQSDIEKYNEAIRLGWRVLRFTGDDLKDCKAIDTVRDVLLAEEER